MQQEHAIKSEEIDSFVKYIDDSVQKRRNSIGNVNVIELRLDLEWGC